MTHEELWAYLAEAFEADGIDNFAPDEFVPRRVLVPPRGIIHRIPLIAAVAQDLRTESGAAVRINSAYRDPDFNRRIGGRPKSWHMQACAIDVDVMHPDWQPDAVQEWAFAHPWAEAMGIGRYRSFTHLDLRGFFGGEAPARWDNRERDIS